LFCFCLRDFFLFLSTGADQRIYGLTPLTPPLSGAVTQKWGFVQKLNPRRAMFAMLILRQLWNNSQDEKLVKALTGRSGGKPLGTPQSCF
jgi:hypothetical protein